MTILQCRYVLKIAETGSFNEAANLLFVSQAALSGAIRELESEMGIQIFTRSNRGILLTDDGAEFLMYARQIVSSDDIIKERYAKGREKEHFSVSTQHYDFVAKAFADFAAQTNLADYIFSLKETKTHEVIEDVRFSVSEIGVLAFAKRSKGRFMDRYLKNNALEFNCLFETKPYVFVGKQHPLSNKSAIGFDELKPYTYITYDQGRNNATQFSEELTQMFDAKKSITISDRATLMNLLLAANTYTIGTGVMPSELNRGGVVSIPLKSNELYSVGYIKRKDRVLSPIGESFVLKLKNIEYSSTLR